ncbi:MAG: NADH-ubiquinone oxidoreductase-F iron-sulfur binding region domain-containing protein [Chloroflexota bacterium]
MPEQRIVLRNCGAVDSRSLDSFLKRDGFEALKKARGTAPDRTIEEVKASGLRGRGGAGFPCGAKWELTRKSPGDQKYIICNADEGEVGTFKDRHIIQNDPFSLIEAIAIAGHAIGAMKGFIYLRAEYRRFRGLLDTAIEQSKERGFLSGFDIEIRDGAGAYVCGEESALMDSIEGRRGEARFKPPFPPTSGLWSKPTVINNVETLMNVPPIILRGSAWFSSIGTERSKGTKVFSVAGDVERPGVYELVMGSHLRELVVNLAKAKEPNLIQIGGATGRIVPVTMLDTPLAFESLLGAGAITVFNNSRDVIYVVLRTMEFLAEESCGKCTPCREGTAVMVGIMERFASGEASERDIANLEALSRTMAVSSLCGLGQAAPTAVTDTLQYFRNTYESRMRKEPVGVKS